jgi:hypothetical protein
MELLPRAGEPKLEESASIFKRVVVGKAIQVVAINRESSCRPSSILFSTTEWQGTRNGPKTSWKSSSASTLSIEVYATVLRPIL